MKSKIYSKPPWNLHAHTWGANPPFGYTLFRFFLIIILKRFIIYVTIMFVNVLCNKKNGQIDNRSNK